MSGKSEEDDSIERAIEGDAVAARQLFHVIYDDLKRLAAAKIRGEDPGITLSATSLVHEAILKLGLDFPVHDEKHLFRLAAKSMRQVLIDSARKRGAQKRFGRLKRVPLVFDAQPGDEGAIDPLELEEALGRLESANPEAATVVDLRYFAGLSLAKIADSMNISEDRASSLWSYAKAKLAILLREE